MYDKYIAFNYGVHVSKKMMITKRTVNRTDGRVLESAQPLTELIALLPDREEGPQISRAKKRPYFFSYPDTGF